MNGIHRETPGKEVETMKLIKVNPMHSLISLPGEIEHFFDDFGLGMQSDRVWNPSVDISENEEAYELKAELPGLKKAKRRKKANPPN